MSNARKFAIGFVVGCGFVRFLMFPPSVGFADAAVPMIAGGIVWGMAALAIFGK